MQLRRPCFAALPAQLDHTFPKASSLYHFMLTQAMCVLGLEDVGTQNLEGIIVARKTIVPD